MEPETVLTEPDAAAEEVPAPETSPETDGEEAAEVSVIEADWERYFDGLNGSAVIYDPAENSYQIYNGELALTRRSPCSTFKIVSSLVALENGIITPEDPARTWSGEIFWNDNWNRDMGFEDAFRASCVWYYREIIDEMGKETMREALDQLQYGNRDISDWEGYLNTNNNNRALTGFWIESSLKISPKEQTEVMARIFGDASPYSQSARDALERVMLQSEPDGTRPLIYGKTGMGKADGVVVDAWFTGFSDTAEKRVYFSVYLGETAGENVSSTRAKEIATEILSDLEAPDSL